jgi:hypothetical protein
VRKEEKRNHKEGQTDRDREKEREIEKRSTGMKNNRDGQDE